MAFTDLLSKLASFDGFTYAALKTRARLHVRYHSQTSTITYMYVYKFSSYSSYLTGSIGVAKSAVGEEGVS